MVQDSTDLDMLVQYLSKNPSTYTKPRWNMITSLSDYRPRCRIDIHLLLRTIAELVSSSNTAVFTWKKWRSLQQQVLPASDLGFFKMCCCDHRKWWIHQQLWDCRSSKMLKKNFEKHNGFPGATLPWPDGSMLIPFRWKFHEMGVPLDIPFDHLF